MNHTDNISRGEEKEKMPTALQVEKYQTLMGIYNDVEKLIKVAELAGDRSEPYLKHLQKYIETVEKETDVILNYFFKLVENGKNLSNMDKLKVEKAAKDISMAGNQFLAKIKN